MKSLPIRRLNIALPCWWYCVTAAISVTVAIRAVVTVVLTATVAAIPVVVDADVVVDGVADVGVGVAVAVDVWADDARHYCCCKVPGAGARKADVDGR